MSDVLTCHSLRVGGQRGAALFIALIALLGLTMVGLALVRTMDAAGLIASNFSFRQSSIYASDLALESALLDLESMYMPAGRDKSYPSSCQGSAGNVSLDANCRYYAWYAYCASCDDANGVSTRINWNHVNLPTNTINVVALGAGYTYKYVIERMCDASVAASVSPETSKSDYCFSMNLGASNGSQTAGSAQLGVIDLSNEVAYRVTVQINGPRGTTAMVQAILMKN